MSEQHETYPNIFEAAVLVAVLIIIELVAAAMLMSMNFLSDVNGDDAALFITVLGNGVLFVGLMAYKKIGYRALFHPSPTSVTTVLGVLTVPVLLLVPGMVTLAGAVNSIVIWLMPMSAEDQSMLESMMSTSVLSTLFGCVAAPVLEEMLFRGIILRSFLRQYSRTKAILWSSVIFAVAHLNVYQLATAIVLGIVAGWLYERCRSLWPGILLHATYNSFVTLIYNFTPDEDWASLFNTATYTAAAFVAAIVGGLLLLKLLSGAANVQSPHRRL